MCFWSGESVQLESGVTVAMSDVHVGDKVQVMKQDGSFAYSEVVYVPHEANQDTTDFVEMETASGRTLKATPGHLVLTTACGEDTASSSVSSMVQAHLLDVDQHCLLTVDGVEALVRVAYTEAKGYATLVAADPNGVLVVNGVAASSFALVHSVPNTYYQMHRLVHWMGWSLNGPWMKATGMQLGMLVVGLFDYAVSSASCSA